MGFLDNTTITVDAILTKVGRKRLSQGTFNISRYALSDEEVDYNLYDVKPGFGPIVPKKIKCRKTPKRIFFKNNL